ncbi:hypothetical protein HK104_005777 [Borealophlyctis nickersoniae]|nr:hypothetical protein HK104_005777 [Borealophlyctis nickersoniae]
MPKGVSDYFDKVEPRRWDVKHFLAQYKRQPGDPSDPKEVFVQQLKKVRGMGGEAAAKGRELMKAQKEQKMANNKEPRVTKKVKRVNVTANGRKSQCNVAANGDINNTIVGSKRKRTQANASEDASGAAVDGEDAGEDAVDEYASDGDDETDADKRVRDLVRDLVAAQRVPFWRRWLSM